MYALPADHRVSEIVENVERNLHVLTGHAKWLAQLMIALDERVNALSGNMAQVLRVRVEQVRAMEVDVEKEKGQDEGQEEGVEGGEQKGPGRER